MSIALNTPSANGTQFQFDIDSQQQEIIIISQNNNQHRYRVAAIRDLYEWLRITKDGQWVSLGTRNETEDPNQGTVEEWARSSTNPIQDWYGITRGLRGRFASFIPPILEIMGLVEVEHNARNNRIRAL